MNDQTKHLLEILSSGLYGKPLSESYENWEELYHLASLHAVGNLFYVAIKNLPNVPDELKAKAQSKFVATVHQQISQEYYAEKVFNALDKKNIRYLPLKGYYLRKLYPTPELRTSCDVDFFYDSSCTNEVNEIMQAHGFIEGTLEHNHSFWQKGSISFEPHFNLLSDNDKFHAYYQNVWDRLKHVSGSLYSFSDEDFYIFFIVHAAKHFTHGGFGIRTVLDIHIYNNAKTLDREYLNGEFDKLGLTKFVKSIEELSECWFNGHEMNEDIERISDYIVESGTFGVTLHALMLNSVKENSVKGSKLSYFLRTLFLPYKQMKGRYPVLQKAPILLPLYWIKRWFEVIFKRRSRVTKTVQTMKSINNEQVDKYSKILQITEVPLD